MTDFMRHIQCLGLQVRQRERLASSRQRYHHGFRPFQCVFSPLQSTRKQNLTCFPIFCFQSPCPVSTPAHALSWLWPSKATPRRCSPTSTRQADLCRPCSSSSCSTPSPIQVGLLPLPTVFVCFVAHLGFTFSVFPQPSTLTSATRSSTGCWPSLVSPQSSLGFPSTLLTCDSEKPGECRATRLTSCLSALSVASGAPSWLLRSWCLCSLLNSTSCVLSRSTFSVLPKTVRLIHLPSQAIWPIGGSSSGTQAAQDFFLSYLAAPIVIAFYIFGVIWKRTAPRKASTIDLTSGRKVWATAEELEPGRQAVKELSWPKWIAYAAFGVSFKSLYSCNCRDGTDDFMNEQAFDPKR